MGKSNNNIPDERRDKREKETCTQRKVGKCRKQVREEVERERGRDGKESKTNK